MSNATKKAKTEESLEMTAADFEKEFAKSEDLSLPEIDGWYDPETAMNKGQPLIGRICGHMVVQGDQGPRDVVLVRLQLPIITMKDDSEHPLKVDDVIGVGVRYGLRPIMDYVEHRGRLMVKASGKNKLKGGKSVWKFEVKCLGKKSQMALASAPTSSDDDIPF